MKISNFMACAVFLSLFEGAGVGLRAENGRSGIDFLRITQSPRASAMGDSGIGLSGDIIGSFQLNTASLGRAEYKEVSAVYNSWIENMAMQQIAYAHPLANGGVLAGSLGLLQTGSIDGYDNSGTAAGTFSSEDKVFSLAYARRIAGAWNNARVGLFGGAALKYEKESFGAVSAETMLYDAGLLSVTEAGGSVIGLGISAQSIGKGLKFDSVQDPAPTMLSAGLGVTAPLYGDPLSLAFDVKKPGDGKMFYSMGVEYLVKGILAWRMGWVSSSDLGSGLRFGAGFDLKFAQFDYALASLGKFGLTHRLSLAHKFGRPVEVSRHLSPAQKKAARKVERAKKLINDGHVYEAILELGDAVELDPEQKETLPLLRRARKLMETSK